MFKSIKISNWRQFGTINIEFHRNLTLLTGANGSGKTTILNLLNRHFGWNLQFISTPKKSKKGVWKYFSDLFSMRNITTADDSSGNEVIGSIEYQSNHSAQLLVPKQVGEAYQIKIQNIQDVKGIFIPSHRPVYVYQKVDNIPTTITAKEQLLQNYMNEIRNRYNVNTRVQSASYRIKEALISLATFGYGNEVMAENRDAVKTFEGFQDILRIVLPKSLGFKRISIRVPDVVLETTSGDFSFDAVSGGVSAIIDIAWQIHMASLIYEEFTVIIDEPENHLHPTLQRELLPNFLEAFPSAQFIVASHNPLIVSSVPDSNVYVLDYDSDEPPRFVDSYLLEITNKAGSSNEILREVLGVEYVKPVWVERRIEDILNKHMGGDVTIEDLRQLREEMRELGAEDVFPSSVERILGRQNDKG